MLTRHREVVTVKAQSKRWGTYDGLEPSDIRRSDATWPWRQRAVAM
jgi:hypothetical protein